MNYADFIKQIGVFFNLLKDMCEIGIVYFLNV